MHNMYLHFFRKEGLVHRYINLLTIRQSFIYLYIYFKILNEKLFINLYIYFKILNEKVLN